MGKLLDKLSEVYHNSGITISDTADLLDVPMESQDLEPATAMLGTAMSGRTTISL